MIAPPSVRPPRPARPARPVLAAVLVLSSLAASAARADVTGLAIAEEKTLTLAGRPVRHLKGTVSGKAVRNEPDIPTLAACKGLTYTADFELWIPVVPGPRADLAKNEGDAKAAAKPGEFVFAVLNRGGDPLSRLREAVLARGGAYGWCQWQAKGIADGRPKLTLAGYEGALPQAFGLVVVRDFVTHLRHAPADGAGMPNPLAGRVGQAHGIGLSQSGRLLRSWIRHGLNADPGGRGRVFDGLLVDGARAGYIDLFRAESDPGGGGQFSPETVHAPFGWGELLSRPAIDPKVFVLNADGEYYTRLASPSRKGDIPAGARIYEFPLGEHGGGGAVNWAACGRSLLPALMDWTRDGTEPPASKVFPLERRDGTIAKGLPDLPAEVPVVDELGVTKGGVRLPGAEVPTHRYSTFDGKTWRAERLSDAELSKRYGTPEGYRKAVAAVVEALVKERYLPADEEAKILKAAGAFTWGGK